MSYEIRLFGVIHRCLDAVIGNTAPLGELSPYGRTFSTQKTKIADTVHENVHALVFNCARDGVDQPMPMGADQAILSVLETLVEDFDVTLDFQSQVDSRFPEIADTVQFHTFVSFNGFILPGYFEWTEVVNGNDVRFMVWLSDSVFRETYDLYEIRVVPPLPNLADLETSEANVREALDNYSVTQQIAAQEEARGEDSVTKNVALTLKWVDPDTSAVLNLTWLLLVFGPEGLRYENQIEAIRNFLRDETGHIPPHWIELIPELDNRTELTFLPLWHQIALRSSGSVDYVHSPVITHTAFTEALRRRTGEDPDLTLVAETDYAITYYKSIGFMVYPEGETSDPMRFTELYPDYAMISVNDVNLNRLHANTREALKAIERGIRIAEVDEGGDLPEGFFRQTEPRLSFICYSVGGVIHRIATRQSFNAAG